MASAALYGSATPSPFASMPYRAQVDGMNCIHPTAPAELGPMLRPKFDSILLIAPRTCHGMPYAAPARCHSASSPAYESDRGAGVRCVHATGSSSEPGVFGVSALGNTSGTPVVKTSARAAADVSAATSAATTTA